MEGILRFYCSVAVSAVSWFIRDYGSVGNRYVYNKLNSFSCVYIVYYNGNYAHATLYVQTTYVETTATKGKSEQHKLPCVMHIIFVIRANMHDVFRFNLICSAIWCIDQVGPCFSLFSTFVYINYRHRHQLNRSRAVYIWFLPCCWMKSIAIHNHLEKNHLDIYFDYHICFYFAYFICSAWIWDDIRWKLADMRRYSPECRTQ